MCWSSVAVVAEVATPAAAAALVAT